jgi:ADP-ribose pyrophosphatase YjhB (NUDIX family)
VATTIAAVPRQRRQSRRSTPSDRHREETSAGGLVVDVGGIPRAVLIARHDREGRLRWSLPKGHVEAQETIEEAAVREVEEETGIRGKIVASLGSIDYWFAADRHRIHKTVHHHLMLAVGGALSDADQEVAEVAWFPLEEVAGRLAHADERRLVVSVPRLLASAT